MTSKYDSFSVFMAEVTCEAKRRITTFGNVLRICILLISAGWPVFIAVCALLVLGPIAFGVSIGPFLLTPPGIIIAGLGGGAALWALYKNKKIPLAIKEVGNRYKPIYEQKRGNNSAVDQIFEDAVAALVRRILDS